VTALNMHCRLSLGAVRKCTAVTRAHRAWTLTLVQAAVLSHLKAEGFLGLRSDCRINAERLRLQRDQSHFWCEDLTTVC
jgi:hypothetical protein